MRKKTKLPSNEDLVEEREELMVSPSENRVSLPPHIQTSNTKSKKKKRKRTKLSPEMEDLVEEREDFMVLPSESSRPSSSTEKTRLLRPCFTTSIEETEAMLPPPPDLKALSLSVCFHGYRLPHIKFKSWAKKMSFLHKPTWKKAGIFEAVVASTKNIIKDSDLVVGMAEKWCPETKTFVFPWGEATITLEDVMLLLGFSVLGSPVFAALDGSGEKKTKEKLEEEWVMLKKSQLGTWLTQAAWMRRFMDSGDELEHVGFLVLWLSYFVFPSRYYHMDVAVFSVAVHLASGTRIALAPAVLAHLYADLTLLHHHTTRSKSIDKIEVNALFKLVQVWTWERFKELQPKPYLLLEGQPRLARWDDVKQGDNDVREILNNSKINSFEWRPYTTTTVENWELPKFYPEREMLVPVGPDLDEEFISFARCIKVSELVGIHSVEHYFPNRVASQFGLLQDVPCPVVNRNKISKEAAWDEYDKPVEGLTLYIPSRSATPRVTPTFCDWWRKWFPQLQRSLKGKGVVESRNIIGDDYDDASASGSRKRKRRKKVCTMGCCQTHDSDDDDLSLTIAQIKRLSIKKCSGGEDASEPLGKRSRFEADNNDTCPHHQELDSVRADGNETVQPPEIEQRNEGNDETGSRTRKSMVDENNSSDPLGVDDATHDTLVSPPLETRQTCDDELDAHGSNVEKISMPDDGNKETKCLLHEDGGMAGEKAISEKKEDESLIQTKITSNEDNNEPTPCQNIASGGSEVHSESKRNEDVGAETQGYDCLFRDTVLRSEETSGHNVKVSIEECIAPGNDDSLSPNADNNEPITCQKRASGGPNGDKTSDESNIQNAVDGGDVSNEKSKLNWKVLASSIEERIAKAERNVALLKLRKATKQRKIAAAAHLI